MSGVKLRLGCGQDPWPGYINIDPDPRMPAQLHAPLTGLRPYFADGTVQEAVLIHSLNSLTLWQARTLFRELHAMLAEDGTLVIETADVARLVEKIQASAGHDMAGYLEGLRAFHGFGLDNLRDQQPYTPNQFSWSAWHLEAELREAGFSDVRVLAPTSHSPWRDMRIEARKAAPARGRVLCLYDPLMGHATCITRGLMFEEEYRRHGWEVRFVDYRQSTPEQILAHAAECNVTYTLKVADLALHRLIKQHTRTRLVFDLTDALWSPVHQQAGWTDLNAILQVCDALFSENERICAYGRQYNARVYSIPVCLQPHKFDAARAALAPRSPDGPLVVGWVGSTGTARALFQVHEALERLALKHPRLELRILGCGDASQLPPFQHLPYTVLAKYDEAVMIEEMLRLDVGIFPAPFGLDDYAVRGGQKAFLYMTAGVPPVCHNAGDCALRIVDGVTGMLVDQPEDWYTKLDQLLSDAALRRRMGQAARDAIRPGTTVEDVFAVMDAALQDVMRA